MTPRTATNHPTVRHELKAQIANLEEEWADMEAQIDEARDRQWEIERDLSSLRDDLEVELRKRTPEEIEADEIEAYNAAVVERTNRILRQRYGTAHPKSVADYWIISPTNGANS